MRLFETVTDLAAQADTLRRRRYGVIEIRDGQLHSVQLRPWPKFCSIWQVAWGQWYHKKWGGDRCMLFYNQPRRAPSFLALKYVVSGKGTSFRSGCRAMAVLEEIAKMKGTDAIVADVANLRISERLLKRWNWESHCPSHWHRHYIKRFYGVYPQSMLAVPREPKKREASSFDFALGS